MLCDDLEGWDVAGGRLKREGIYLYIELPRWHGGKDSACQCRRHKRPGFDPWVRKIPWIRKWQLIPVFLPGEFHGQRNLVSYSPQGVTKSQTQLSN